MGKRTDKESIKNNFIANTTKQSHKIIDRSLQLLRNFVMTHETVIASVAWQSLKSELITKRLLQLLHSFAMTVVNIMNW